MNPLVTCLGYVKDCEKAVDMYVSVFNEVFGNSRILGETRFSEREMAALRTAPGMTDDLMPGGAGSLKTIRLMLNGQELIALNGGPYFGRFNESMSLYVSCDTQEQIDRLWQVLSDGGEEQPCGWVKDKFGVSWQIAPAFVWEVDESADRETADRMLEALYNMKKIESDQLKRAMGK